MTGYTKLFSSIIHSTVWREPDHVRVLWITLLAMAGKSGVAETSIPGLADASRVSLKHCEDALRRLQAPDPYSRTGDDEGRRIRPVDGGWLIINHGKYRAKMSADERREYLRLKKAESRTRLSTPSQHLVDLSRLSTHTEAEADPKAEQIQTTTSSVVAEPHVVVWTKSGVQSDRIYLHRWQLEALIDTLGPHADDFALDLWVAGLSAKATAEGLVLPRNSVWAWVQAELTKEIQTRGLPLATIGDVTDADKLAALIAKGPSVRP